MIEAKVQARLKLVDLCRRIVGEDMLFDGKSDDELKLLSIKKFHPNLDLADKDHSYIDGMFEALIASKTERNDSLSTTRQAIVSGASANVAYEKWLEQSAKMWTNQYCLAAGFGMGAIN